MPKKLETMDAETLMSTPMEPLKFIVIGLLPQGIHVLAGSPKIGKSWLSLWICLQAAKGKKVWEFDTLQSEVLYLCLEDSFARIQSRLFEITDEAPPTLHLQHRHRIMVTMKTQMKFAVGRSRLTAMTI